MDGVELVMLKSMWIEMEIVYFNLLNSHQSYI
jgi:hypothetical protein